LGKLSPFFQKAQKSRQLTQSDEHGVRNHYRGNVEENVMSEKLNKVTTIY